MKIATNQERLNELFDSDPRNDTQIGNALNVSKQTISMWRHGTRSPKKSMLLKICDEFGVSIEWLMGFDVEKVQTEGRPLPIFGSDNQKFAELVRVMPFEDYKTMIDILRRAEQKLRQQGIKL